MTALTEVDVYLDAGAADPVHVGSLRASFSGGRNLAAASFVYDSLHLARPGAYAISPDLPLTGGRMFTSESGNLFGAFMDTSPDSWGCQITTATRAAGQGSASHAIGDFDFMLGASDFTRMGALRLRSGEEWLSPGEGAAAARDLDHVLAAVRRYEEREASNADLTYLSSVAASTGGARPKANVVTGSGRLALAKFPHVKDRVDVGAWEVLALTVARNAGVRTPAFTARRAAGGTTVIIERFDRDRSGARRHYISAATALGLGVHDGGRVTYAQFAGTISALSSNPDQDLCELFTRVALTVLINNVDDHWKNHGFLRSTAGWQLSPIFDVNPNPVHGVVSSRAISGEDDPRRRDIRNLLRTAGEYRLTEEQASAIVRAVVAQVERWPSVAKSLGIPADEQAAMAAAFDETQLAVARAFTPKLSSTTLSGPRRPRSTGGPRA